MKLGPDAMPMNPTTLMFVDVLVADDANADDDDDDDDDDASWLIMWVAIQAPMEDATMMSDGVVTVV